MSKHLRVFVCTGFAGHWPVGTSAVVVAPDEDTARSQLARALADKELPQEEPLILSEIDTTQTAAHVLNDGEY